MVSLLQNFAFFESANDTTNDGLVILLKLITPVPTTEEIFYAVNNNFVGSCSFVGNVVF